MLLDSGITYMMAPQEDLDIIMGALQGKGIECTDNKVGMMTTTECTCTDE